ncbi:protein kinase family protein / peptidoglycan-binding LysM domain-containing protein [Euphorbia peplus]|nr:protein kinase family protein / peptidoglycan-binding LysM domain-containing protein [Euphorbia peplus]
MGSLVLLVFFLVSPQIFNVLSYSTQPMNCTDTTRLCTSFLAFKPPKNLTLPVIQSMFDVLAQDVMVEDNDHGRKSKAGAVISLRLFCGCSNGLWNYLMSYVMEEDDSVESLSSRFGVSMDSIEAVNGIGNPDNVTVGALYYVPLNSVPGEPYPVENNIPPSPAPVPEPSSDNFSENTEKHKAHVPFGWIIGSLGIGIALVVFCITICICLKSSCCYSKPEEDCAKESEGKSCHKFHILRKPSFCCASRRFISDQKQTNGETSSHHIAIPKGLESDILHMEKPMVFTYEEVDFATDGFSDSSLIGHGTYGSVYYGHLGDQEVAVKRMTATKTKEFMAELKVLCKVHHTNLVELIGYAASDVELFLIYEYAQKGSLKSHIHDPQNKGHTPLSWNIRVQIALDAARGLEYIHEHTKTHYVHRDIKTSNILLDGSFRAKISDFGLAKLVGKTGDGETTATKVVGTFGYLAPEYLSDGLATAKSDVYAFGVVLFEIISGREAIIRTEGSAAKNPERRSLASVMLAALRSSHDSMSMSSLKDHIDPNMMDLYPHDCVFKMAMLAKQCVDEDPILRPDMKQVVISLSQILLSSIEWEATLAGNSQVFSGLVQGR